MGPLTTFMWKKPANLKCLLRMSTSLNLKNKSFSSTVESKNHYDIVIAGGGMIGTTLACTLAKNKKLSDKRILLLEGGKKFKWRFSEKFSNRVSALNPGTQKLLESIGAWKHIADVRYGSVKKLQIWDALSNAMITFDNDNMNDTVAYIVENDLTLNAVWKELKGLSNVHSLNEAKLKTYLLPDEKEIVNVTLENGNTYSCNLLLGCDGANSLVRRIMGTHYLNWSYDQMGVVATIKLADIGENAVAWQRFLPTGPLALLPLTNDVSSLVWSTTPTHAKELLALSEEQFIDALNDAIWKVYPAASVIESATKAFDNFLTSINCSSNAVRQLPPRVCGVEVDSRAAFPLGFGHAANYISCCVALVGDAAHRVHPLAGQGVNLGFGDIICLNEILGEAVYSGSSIGLTENLKQYETERQRHNIPTMIAIDGLHKLYNTDFTPLVVLRSIGLQITHALTPLKRAIISQAAN